MPLSSPAERALLISAELKAYRGKITNAQAAQLTDCILSKSESRGIKTVAQLAQRSASGDLSSVITPCLKEVGLL
jgi:hypothetical protein